MSEVSGNRDPYDDSGSVGSDGMEDLLNLSEQQVNEIILGDTSQSEMFEARAGKRIRQESEGSKEDEGFVTVMRNKKRVARSNSKNSENSVEKDPEGRVESQNIEKYVVCITGTKALPKQFGMAKLMKSENIVGILNIKYKSSFRALIEFNNNENAEKLMSCVQIQSAGYRCQKIDEVNLTYGIVRQIDLDAEESEIMENFLCETEIVSVRRLKRQTFSGQWTFSETVRLCFKGTTLPPYVFGYGSRFKVDPYIFPVTQCSGCWKFGHPIKFCPTKKILCPKCGEGHPNCETENYECLNCKGNHMALNKLCPVFLKEKEVRKIMSQEKCTYRKALKSYLEKTNDDKINDNDVNCNTYSGSPKVNARTSQLNTDRIRSYRDVLATNAIIHEESSTSLESEDEQQYCERQNNTHSSRIPKNKDKRRKKKSYEQETGENVEELENTGPELGPELDPAQDPAKGPTPKLNMDFKKILAILKSICISNHNLSVKLSLALSVICEEIIRFIQNFFKDIDWFNSIIGLLCNG